MSMCTISWWIGDEKFISAPLDESRIVRYFEWKMEDPWVTKLEIERMEND